MECKMNNLRKFEEFNWKPFKKRHINDHDDIDPLGEEDWNDEKDYIEKFKEFLKKEKIYDKYIRYINDPHIKFAVNDFEDLRKYLPSHYIEASLLSSKTPEGMIHWAKKSEKWRKIIGK